MKIKNNTIFTIIVTFLGAYVLLAGYLKFTEKNIIHPKIERENEIINEKETEIAPKVLSLKNTEIQEIEVEPLSDPLSEEINKINVSLSVLDQKYELEIEDGSSVFEVMKQLKNSKANNFDFKYKEYPGMGAFIYEINGIKEKRGEYWIYYVNDKEASVGVSSYFLSPGDSILWKQE